MTTRVFKVPKLLRPTLIEVVTRRCPQFLASGPEGLREVTLSDSDREKLVEHLGAEFTSRGLRDDCEPTRHGVLVDDLVYLFSFVDDMP